MDWNLPVQGGGYIRRDMLINVNRVSAFDLFVVSEGNFLAKIISIRYQSVVRRRGGRIDVEGEQGDPFHARFPPVKVRLVISIEDIYIYEMIEGQAVSKPFPEKFLRRLTRSRVTMRYRRLESGSFEYWTIFERIPPFVRQLSCGFVRRLQDYAKFQVQRGGDWFELVDKQADRKVYDFFVVLGLVPSSNRSKSIVLPSRGRGWEQRKFHPLPGEKEN